MFHSKSNSFISLLMCAGCILACEEGRPQQTPIDSIDGSPSSEQLNRDTGEHVLVPSTRPRVKFKGAKRYGADLSQALNLPIDALCNELGLYACLEVHNIVLGGVEPYRAGINKPLERASATAPIAVDRVALTACIERVELDFSSANEAVFFEALPEASADPSETWLKETSNRLYQRILRRSATSTELKIMADFYVEVSSEFPQSKRDALRQWQTLSCFMLATSTEALFY